MSRLVFVISDLEGGGAQRVAVALLERWAAQGWDVDLVTVATDAGDFFAVPSGVTRTVLDRPNRRRRLWAVIGNNLDRLRGIRRLVKSQRPDVVVSFLDATNVLTLLATVGMSVPVVVSERNDPRHQPLGRPWRILRRIVYRRATRVVVQTNSVQAWAAASFPRTETSVIPNPVSVPPASDVLDLGGPYIVGVGRLSAQKGFDLLVSAFAAIREQHPAWRLTIAGEGEDRAALEAQIRALHLDGSVHLLGRVRDIGRVLTGASVFALSSRYEGFPNALLEAMACGLPCVATRCPSGPEEIITDGDDGLLVAPGSVAELASALDALLGDDVLRKALGIRARASVLERFNIDAIGARWDALLAADAVR